MNRKNSFWAKKISLLDKLIYKLRVHNIRKFVNFNNKIILDLWCWYNANLLNYIKNNFSPKKLIAFDIKLNTKLLEKNEITTFEWNLDENFNLPEKPDLIICTAVLEHLNDPIKFLKQIYKNLSPNWYLILTVPSIRSKPVLEFLALKLNLIDKEEILDHKEYYTRKKLIEYLTKAWFSKESIKHKYFEIYMNNFISAWKIIKENENN